MTSSWSLILQQEKCLKISGTGYVMLQVAGQIITAASTVLYSLTYVSRNILHLILSVSSFMIAL